MSDQPEVHVGEILSGDKITADALGERLKDIAVDRAADRYHVGETDPKPFGEYPGLSRALLDGATLHAFRSGGGLRVVRLEKGPNPGERGELLAYGEHPYIEQAFDYCEEDFQAGGRDYKTVYGGIHQHFLTGSSTPSSIVDRWVLAGRDFDIFANGGLFTFKGEYHVNAIPREVHDRVTKTRQEETFIDSRGFVFKIVPFVFPGNGEHASSASVIHKPDGHEGYNSYEYPKPVVIMAATLGELLAKMAEEFPPTFERV